MVREIVHDPMFLGQKSVDATEDEFSYGREEKVFTPHITLVRKSTGNPGKITIPNADMMVKRVSLMKSENVKGKMVYKEIYHI